MASPMRTARSWGVRLRLSSMSVKSSPFLYSSITGSIRSAGGKCFNPPDSLVSFDADPPFVSILRLYATQFLVKRFKTVMAYSFKRLQISQKVGGVMVRQRVEEAFGHEAGFGEAGATDFVLRDATILGVGLAQDDRFVVLGNKKAVEDVAVFKFDTEGAVARFHGRV